MLDGGNDSSHKAAHRPSSDTAWPAGACVLPAWVGSSWTSPIPLAQTLRQLPDLLLLILLLWVSTYKASSPPSRGSSLSPLAPHNSPDFCSPSSVLQLGLPRGPLHDSSACLYLLCPGTPLNGRAHRHTHTRTHTPPAPPEGLGLSRIPSSIWGPQALSFAAQEGQLHQQKRKPSPRKASPCSPRARPQGPRETKEQHA